MTTEALLTETYRVPKGLLVSLLRAFFSGKNRTDKDSLLTLPNVISLTRIPLGIMVWLLVDNPNWRLTAMLFAAAAISDFLDGVIAEFMGPTHWGAMIDPTCDKAFFFLCAIAYRNRFEPWAFWAIVAVEVFILVAPYTLILTRKIDSATSDFRSNIYGKDKFALECAAILMVIVRFPREAFQLYAAGTVIIITPGTVASFVLFAAAVFGVLSIRRKIKDSVWAAQKQ